MKCYLLRLWNDERGFLLSSEAILYASILVIGIITGFSAIRESVVTELADVGQAIANLNQSFQVGGVVGHCAATSGSTFIDTWDFCDAPFNYPVINSKCITICTGVGNFFCSEAGIGTAGFYGGAGYYGAAGVNGAVMGTTTVNGSTMNTGS